MLCPLSLVRFINKCFEQQQNKTKQKPCFLIDIPRVYRQLSAFVVHSLQIARSPGKKSPKWEHTRLHLAKTKPGSLQAAWAQAEARPGEWAHMPFPIGQRLLSSSLLNYSRFGPGWKIWNLVALGQGRCYIAGQGRSRLKWSILTLKNRSVRAIP